MTNKFEKNKKYRINLESFVDHGIEEGIPPMIIVLGGAEIADMEFTTDDSNAFIEDGVGYTANGRNIHHRWVEEV